MTDMNDHPIEDSLPVSPSDFTRPPPGAFNRIGGNQRIASAHQIDESLLVVSSYGSEPRLINGRWSGSGLSFHHEFRHRQREYLHGSSEAQLDIEYWFTETSFHVIQATFEPIARAIVPLFEHTFVLKRFPSLHQHRLLLSPSIGASENVDDLVRQLAGTKPSDLRSQDDIHPDLLLYRLRNRGLIDTSAALAAIGSFWKLPWCDGAVAETAASICAELQLVLDLSNARVVLSD